MSSLGRRASAWAISSRCCSPPESCPIGRWANSPAPTVALTPDQTVRPPSSTVASVISTSAGRTGSSGIRASATRDGAAWRGGVVDISLPYVRLGERLLQGGELRHLPVPERGTGRGQRLGDRGHRDAGLLGLVDLRRYVGRGVLAVVDVHLDLLVLDLRVDRGLVRGGRV